MQDITPVVQHNRLRRYMSGCCIVLLLLLTSLAGCLSESDEPADEPHGFDWEPGQWWSYKISGSLPAPWMESDQIGMARELGHEMAWPAELNITLVRAPDSSDRSGSMLPDDPYAEYLSAFGLPLATQWESGGWTTGSIIESYNKEGPHIRGTTFIQWPLTDGKNWETRFMGRDLQITAARDHDGYQMVASDGDNPLLRYRVDPEARWFSSFEILDGEGHVQAKAVLVDHGREGFTKEVYQISNGSYGIWCHGGAGALPASPAICPAGSLSIRVHPGGQSDFFHHRAYQSTGPGMQTILYSTPDGTVEVENAEECPCDANRYWQESVDMPGVHSWQVSDVFSGSERWNYFSVYYACQTIYKMEGNDLQEVDRCGP